MRCLGSRSRPLANDPRYMRRSPQVQSQAQQRTTGWLPRGSHSRCVSSSQRVRSRLIQGVRAAGRRAWERRREGLSTERLSCRRPRARQRPARRPGRMSTPPGLCACASSCIERRRTWDVMIAKRKSDASAAAIAAKVAATIAPRDGPLRACAVRPGNGARDEARGRVVSPLQPGALAGSPRRKSSGIAQHRGGCDNAGCERPKDDRREDGRKQVDRQVRSRGDWNAPSLGDGRLREPGTRQRAGSRGDTRGTPMRPQDSCGDDKDRHVGNQQARLSGHDLRIPRSGDTIPRRQFPSTGAPTCGDCSVSSSLVAHETGSRPRPNPWICPGLWHPSIGGAGVGRRTASLS